MELLLLSNLVRRNQNIVSSAPNKCRFFGSVGLSFLNPLPNSWLPTSQQLVFLLVVVVVVDVDVDVVVVVAVVVVVLVLVVVDVVVVVVAGGVVGGVDQGTFIDPHRSSMMYTMAVVTFIVIPHLVHEISIYIYISTFTMKFQPNVAKYILRSWELTYPTYGKGKASS